MSDKSVPLEVEIRQRIERGGPISVANYMTMCLTHPRHGYYMTRDPFGTAGDFTTAPEISQMFGELVGLWASSVWQQMGSPPGLILVELGPGRGSMMLDALRAAQLVRGFRSSVEVHFVEISPALEQRQRQSLGGISVPVTWHRSLDEVPEGPTIILANEFFDALPVNQVVMCADGWHERVVKIDANDRLQFSAARDPYPLFDPLLPKSIGEVRIGEIYEWRSDQMALEIGRRVMRGRGAALVIDYGHRKSATGDTMQAVGEHRFADPLTKPGQIDLTAHVDFDALAQAAESMGARSYGPIDQGDFLRYLGIESRAAALKAGAPHGKAAEIDAALRRLTADGGDAMGRLFKAIAFTHPNLDPPAGFESL
jgi:NADH dehydrogenase [ubiquinone] 1 alpha subcomplex assembly factor 7